MVVVHFKPYIPENYSDFLSASETNKWNSRERTVDLPFSFRCKHITFLKATFCLHRARVCITGFGATFAAVFDLIYWLRELPLSAVANRFELRCQLKQFCDCITKSVIVILGTLL